MTAVSPDSAKQRTIAFLNLAHALDHFVLLIYPTVVIGLEVIYRRPYSELIALSSTAFRRVRRVLASGRLARRPLEPAQHDGAVLFRLRRVARAPLSRRTCRCWPSRMFVLGMFAAIYHPVGMAMLIELRSARPHARLQRRVRQSRRRAGGRHLGGARGLAGLARGVPRPGGDLPRHRGRLSRPRRRRPPSRRQAQDHGRSVLAPRAMALMFGCYIVISLAGGLTFNTALIALPKLIDERVGQG